MSDEVKKTIEVLRAGGIILYPTDTVWGIGCDATNAEAVEKIYKIKQRDDSKSMLVITDGMARIQSYVDEIPDIAWDLAELADKPITIIYPQAKNLAANLISDDGSIGIRISSEKFSKQLCAAFRRPIVSTSANISGEPSPECFAEISDIIKDQMDYIVQYRQDDTQKKQASSIIKLKKNGTFVILRH
ncbi:MAG: threonylcarbamoyl-AMP synthase [Paludibacteraceae bacterium]|nr:threonylcarbamoyl-AMP synthase [Paludibacteraceae bacterium]HPG55566.1 L-threonylcarbamoyladenylate synthase [Candidatus Enterocola sp.]